MSANLFHHTFWTAGDLRCILVSRHRSTSYLVQVCEGDRVLQTASCGNPDEGAVLAERFWREYVELIS